MGPAGSTCDPYWKIESFLFILFGSFFDCSAPPKQKERLVLAAGWVGPTKKEMGMAFFNSARSSRNFVWWAQRSSRHSNFLVCNYTTIFVTQPRSKTRPTGAAPTTTYYNIKSNNGYNSNSSCSIDELWGLSCCVCWFIWALGSYGMDCFPTI